MRVSRDTIRKALRIAHQKGMRAGERAAQEKFDALLERHHRLKQLNGTGELFAQEWGATFLKRQEQPEKTPEQVAAEVWQLAPDPSHVESFRFIEEPTPAIEVVFKAKGKYPASEYRYDFPASQRDTARVVWEELAAVDHPGIVIWHWLIRGGVPYKRLKAFVKAVWEESKHHRGQPGNPGQFGPGGGSEREEIGEGNTGKVHREGDEVIKNAKLTDGKDTREGEFYDSLRNVEGIAPGYRRGDEIRLPHYQEILSVDAVPDERIRQSMGDVVAPNVKRLLNAANALSEEGIDYNDPLQVGYDDDYKAHVIDFSNAGRVDPKVAQRANIERTARYLEDFGLPQVAEKVLTAFGVFNQSELLSGGSAESAVKRMTALAAKGNKIAEHIVSLGAAKLAGYKVKHAYYATNARHVDAPGVLQSEPIDGLKVIVADKPIDADIIRQYSLVPVVHPATRSKTERKSWSESDHPRDHGKFSSSPGSSGSDIALSQPDAKTGEHPAKSKAARLIARIGEVPNSLKNKVTAFVKDRYGELVTKFGKKGAAAILGASVLMLPVPAPFASLYPIAIANAVHRLIYGKVATDTVEMVAKAVDEELTEEEIQEHAKKFLAAAEKEVADHPHPHGSAAMLALLEHAIPALELGEDPTHGIAAILGQVDGEEAKEDTVAKGFDPNEKRDESGKWTTGGGGGSSAVADYISRYVDKQHAEAVTAATAKIMAMSQEERDKHEAGVNKRAKKAKNINQDVIDQVAFAVIRGSGHESDKTEREAKDKARSDAVEHVRHGVTDPENAHDPEQKEYAEAFNTLKNHFASGGKLQRYNPVHMRNELLNKHSFEFDSETGRVLQRQSLNSTKYVLLDTSVVKELASLVSSTERKAFDPAKHPRGDDGRFIESGAISAARTDPAKKAELRKRVTDPKELEKLDAALAEPSPEHSRQKKQALRKQGVEITKRIHAARNADKSGEYTPQDVRDLAESIPHMSLDELRSARDALRYDLHHGRTEQTKRDLVPKLVEHARVSAQNMEEARGKDTKAPEAKPDDAPVADDRDPSAVIDALLGRDEPDVLDDESAKIADANARIAEAMENAPGDALGEDEPEVEPTPTRPETSTEQLHRQHAEQMRAWADANPDHPKAAQVAERAEARHREIVAAALPERPKGDTEIAPGTFAAMREHEGEGAKRDATEKQRNKWRHEREAEVSEFQRHGRERTRAELQRKVDAAAAKRTREDADLGAVAEPKVMGSAAQETKGPKNTSAIPPTPVDTATTVGDITPVAQPSKSGVGETGGQKMDAVSRLSVLADLKAKADEMEPTGSWAWKVPGALAEIAKDIARTPVDEQEKELSRLMRWYHQDNMRNPQADAFFREAYSALGLQTPPTREQERIVTLAIKDAGRTPYNDHTGIHVKISDAKSGNTVIVPVTDYTEEGAKAAVAKADKEMKRRKKETANRLRAEREVNRE